MANVKPRKVYAGIFHVSGRMSKNASPSGTGVGKESLMTSSSMRPVEIRNILPTIV